MTYSGTPLNAGPSRILDGSHHAQDVLKNTADLDVGITVVTGLTPSGHALLRIRYRVNNGLKSSYFHVDEAGTSSPKFIDGKHDFAKYLLDNGKTLKGTVWFARDPTRAQALINRLNLYATGAKKYTWGGGYHTAGHSRLKWRRRPASRRPVSARCVSSLPSRCLRS